MYRIAESVHCTPETNATLCVNNTSLKKEYMKEINYKKRRSYKTILSINNFNSLFVSFREA